MKVFLVTLVTFLAPCIAEEMNTPTTQPKELVTSNIPNVNTDLLRPGAGMDVTFTNKLVLTFKLEGHTATDVILRTIVLEGMI